jgi:hypothetical protein
MLGRTGRHSCKAGHVGRQTWKGRQKGSQAGRSGPAEQSRLGGQDRAGRQARKESSHAGGAEQARQLFRQVSAEQAGEQGIQNRQAGRAEQAGR